MDSEETLQEAIRGILANEREADGWIKHLEETNANAAEIFLAKKQKTLFQSIRRQFEQRLEKLIKLRTQTA